MTATQTAMPSTGEGSVGGSSLPPRTTTGTQDRAAGGGIPLWKVVSLIGVVIVLAIIAVFGVVKYKNTQANEKLQHEQTTNALRDLNNRLTTEAIGGQFTEVFFVGKQMRARWQSNDGQKRCVMQVASPTDDVLRYSTLDVPDDTAGFKQFTDPNTVGCLTSGGAGGIGGG